MENIKEAFEIVFGEEFVREMTTRLLIIAYSFAAVLLIVIGMVVWKSIACRKVKKAILALSEHPDDNGATQFLSEIGKISAVGKFFAKHGSGYSGLSKSDCRTIYNATILPSAKIGSDNKKAVRDGLMKIGCNGLTDVESV